MREEKVAYNSGGKIVFARIRLIRLPERCGKEEEKAMKPVFDWPDPPKENFYRKERNRLRSVIRDYAKALKTMKQESFDPIVGYGHDDEMYKTRDTLRKLIKQSARRIKALKKEEERYVNN